MNASDPVTGTPSCLFCSAAVGADIIEHIIPESLVGDHEAHRVRGLVCVRCNNYFGSHVERDALASFPFNVFRVTNSVVTKKGQPARLDGVIQGPLFSTPRRNVVAIEPRNEMFRHRLLSGATQMRILAEVEHAVAVCRLLIKMGCEHLATFDPTEARGDRLAAARAFSRAPKRGTTWWFLLLSDPSRLGQEDSCFLDVVEEQGALMVHFHADFFDMFAPMTDNVEPASELDAPPGSRLYRVKV